MSSSFACKAPLQIAVLACIAEPISAVDVFDYLKDNGFPDVTRSGVFNVLSNLKQHGYATESPDPDDARFKLVQQNAKGRKLFTSRTSLVELLFGIVSDHTPTTK